MTESAKTAKATTSTVRTPKAKATTTTTTTTTVNKPIAVPAVNKPFYASIGSGDAALARLRSLSTTYATTAKTQQDKLTIQVKELRGALSAQAKELPATVAEIRGSLTRGLSDLPELVKTLPAQATKVGPSATSQAQAFQEQVKVLSTKVSTTAIAAWRGEAEGAYADLATRGHKLVNSIRDQVATAEAEKAAKQTISQAKGLRTQASSAAKQTVSQAKRIRTSATKAAKAAGKAGKDAVAKIG